jgi:hypothetical protein
MTFSTALISRNHNPLNTAYLASRYISLVVTRGDLSLDLFRPFTLMACPREAFVVVTSIDFGDFGIQGRGLLVIRKPLRKRCLPTRPDTRQHLMCLHQRLGRHWFGGLVHGHGPSLVSPVSYSRAWDSNAPAADSMAAKIHQGNVVAAAICRQAAATAQDAAAISRDAAGSPLPDRAVVSQARPYCR